jgi:hypothetical protein
LNVELANMPMTMVFEVSEASLRVAAAQQLEDVRVTWHAQEGDSMATIVFKVGEASSRVARELENIEAAWRKAAAAWELKEGNRVTTVFEIGDDSSRAP